MESDRFRDEAANASVESSITPEQQAEIDRIKRRNLIIAAVFGVILMLLGFFAGGFLKERGENNSMPTPSVSVVDTAVSAL